MRGNWSLKFPKTTVQVRDYLGFTRTGELVSRNPDGTATYYFPPCGPSGGDGFELNLSPGEARDRKLLALLVQEATRRVWSF